MGIMGIGHCTLDHFGVVDRLPDAGMKSEMVKFSVQGGGAAATAMVVLARWGEQTRFCGKVGDDHRSQIIESTLVGEGVDTGGLVHQPGSVSQFTFVAVERNTAQTRQLYTRGNVTAMEPAEVEDIDLEGVELVVADGQEPAAQLALMRRAREAGVSILLDASRMEPEDAELVEHCDFILASERFASRFTGVGDLDGLCRELLEAGPNTVAMTLGDEGAVGASRAEPELVRLPAHEVVVQDATGAGDVFLGAFAYGLTRDWPLRRIIETANVAAGLSCAGLGARGSIPPLENVQKWVDADDEPAPTRS